MVQVEEQIRELQQRLEEMGKRDAARADPDPPPFVDMADCCVCLVEEREAGGLRCNVAVGSGHFLCAECLQARPDLTRVKRLVRR
jgi:hypothetical protein